MEEQEFDMYELSFDIRGIRLMKGVIDSYIKIWPGYPARPREEQEFLWFMRDEMNKMMLEHSFNHLSTES